MENYTLASYLKAINETKEPLLDTEDIIWEKKYPPFIINRCLSLLLQFILHHSDFPKDEDNYL